MAKSKIRLVQAKLNPNKKRERDLIELIEAWEATRIPDDPNEQTFTQKDVIMMALEEWSETIPEYPPNGEYMFSLMKRLERNLTEAIRKSHQSLLEALSTLDLTTYVNNDTGRTMHDEIGGLLVDDETLNNLTSEPIIEYEDDEDEPEGWQ